MSIMLVISTCWCQGGWGKNASGTVGDIFSERVLCARSFNVVAQRPASGWSLSARQTLVNVVEHYVERGEIVINRNVVAVIRIDESCLSVAGEAEVAN